MMPGKKLKIAKILRYNISRRCQCLNVANNRVLPLMLLMLATKRLHLFVVTNTHFKYVDQRTFQWPLRRQRNPHIQHM
uniref:Uncharacterized protein n=1 Tax=Arundo donax TaxID=35708 RepID=A0A0A8Y989_ARUDO